METSVKANEVVVPSQSDVTDSSLLMDGEVSVQSAACASSDPMEEFRRRLDDIVSGYSKSSSVLEGQVWLEAETDKKKEEEDNCVTMETEMSLVMQSLSQLSSPEQKLQDLVMKYAEMAALRRSDEQKMSRLQQKFGRLLDERQQLQREQRNSVAARSKLEALCRDLQVHYTLMREETLERCKEEEEKRNEMTTHFQSMLTDIQTQIEQHNNRNERLCRENSNLTEKLESLMSQCETREESLEKINKHRDLQQKLTEARLAQTSTLLVEAEEKHKREKEYLLREAIDKTKKCFAMKEQELALKKKLLVQAAEWKLQAQSLREQGTVMQTQLTLYAQKFDEFQGTLAKSNEIFQRFKKEMDTMSEKMKKMEKESNVWKTRFENCNKALTDMLEERTEKGKEYDTFVLKIQKLEKLCRALQDERKILYDKIKDVRRSNADISSKVFGEAAPDSPQIENSVPELSAEEIITMQCQDPVLTQDMARLREEQAKLQLFAESLLYSEVIEEVTAELDLEEDIVSSAIAQFKTKKETDETKPDTKQDEKDIKEESSTTETQQVDAEKAEVKMETVEPETEQLPGVTPEPENDITAVKVVPEKVEDNETKVEVPAIKEVTAKVPGVEEVKAEVPAVEEVKDEVPAVEEVKAEVPAVEEVKAEVPADEEVKAEVPAVEEVKAEVPADEEVKAEVPAVKEVKAEVPADEEVKVEVSAVEEVKAEDPEKDDKPLEVEQNSEEAASKSEPQKTAESSMKQAPKKKKKRSNKNAS